MSTCLLSGRTRRRAGGYTLGEVLVVVAILAVLVGLLLAAVQKVRATAAAVRCQNQLRQAVLAVQTFHAQNQYLPANTGAGVSLYSAPGKPYSPKPPPLPGGTGHPSGSFLFHILPYIDQEALWRQADARDLCEATARLTSAPAPFYRCPARDGPLVADITDTAYWGPADILGYPLRHGLGDYAANTLLYRDTQIHERWYPTLGGVSDGTSNTVYAAEKARGRWVEPRSPHSGYGGPWVDGRLLNSLSLPAAGDTRALCRDSEFTKWLTDTKGDFPPGPLSAATMQHGPGSPHPGGVPVAACDGSVRAVRFDLPATVWAALLTPDKGDAGRFY